MTHPVCERCGKEIVPGSMVEFVGLDPTQILDGQIFQPGELIVVHLECPKEEPNAL